MAKPKYMFQCGPAAFPEAPVRCLGTQVSAVVAAVSAVRPDLVWYAADVVVPGPSPFARGDGVPRRIGDSAALTRAAEAVHQFEWGIFAGVEPECGEPRFRAAELWTEDEEDADLGDAVVEVRSFDTDYISVGTSDPAILDEVMRRFPGTEVQ